MIPRPHAIDRIAAVFKVHPVAALLGPRQCGKTTLARKIAEGESCTYFDLENPVDLRRLSAPMSTLEELSGLVKGVSESLAGRIGFIDLSGFDLRKVGPEQRFRLWIRGGFPKSFLADEDLSSKTWREDFIRTFLERDIPQLGITIPAEILRRFWTMISHYHGQVWNAAHFARSLGTSEKTARRYLDILAGAYMVRILPPWFENIRRRQVKAPKIYIRDSGIMHTLLQINTMADLQGHPKLGSSWEGFCLELVIGGVGTRGVYFWATHAGAELDLLATVAGKRYGFEFKYADAPGSSRSMHIAIKDLGLEHLWVVYPGRHEYDIDENISAIPIDLIHRLAVLQK